MTRGYPTLNPMRQPRRLDDFLNFRLNLMRSLTGAPIVRLLEGRYGITRRQWGVLALLADRGQLSPSELAKEVLLDRARTSRLIGLLVEKKLVVREALAADPRRARVSLTASGRCLYDRIFPEIANINVQLVSSLDDVTLDALDNALLLLKAKAEHLNKATATDIKSARHKGGSRRLLEQRILD